MVPASATPFWVILAIIVFLLVLAALFGFIAYSAKNVRFELTDEGLQIRGGIYGRFIPKGSLIEQNAKIVSLTIQKEYQPRIRTSGIGLPGYSEGWFRLKNGEKALLFVTRRSSVLYIPTTEGYSVLLSAHQPKELLKSMDELWKE
jgi:hypothetical protein